MAHAGDDLGCGKQLVERRQTRAPGAVGVDDDLGWAVGVVVLEQTAQQALTQGIIDEHAEFVAPPHFTKQGAEPIR